MNSQRQFRASLRPASSAIVVVESSATLSSSIEDVPGVIMIDSPNAPIVLNAAGLLLSAAMVFAGIIMFGLPRPNPGISPPRVVLWRGERGRSGHPRRPP